MKLGLWSNLTIWSPLPSPYPFTPPISPRTFQSRKYVHVAVKQCYSAPFMFYSLIQSRTKCKLTSMELKAEAGYTQQFVPSFTYSNLLKCFWCALGYQRNCFQLITPKGGGSFIWCVTQKQQKVTGDSVDSTSLTFAEQSNSLSAACKGSHCHCQFAWPAVMCTHMAGD